MTSEASEQKAPERKLYSVEITLPPMAIATAGDVPSMQAIVEAVCETARLGGVNASATEMLSPGEVPDAFDPDSYAWGENENLTLSEQFPHLFTKPPMLAATQD